MVKIQIELDGKIKNFECDNFLFIAENSKQTTLQFYGNEVAQSHLLVQLNAQLYKEINKKIKCQ